jgi:three-Cys-motif partner protein
MIGVRGRFNNISKLAYIDLFCGPGRYDDGSKSTPIMVLENAIRSEELSKLLVTMFNDRDPDNVRSLNSEIETLPGIEKLSHKPMVYCSEVDSDAEAMFAKTNLCPTFSFVDPFGYKGLSAKFIRAIVKNWGCDCVFFFNYGRINAGIGNPLVERHMNALFGEERADRMRKILKDMKPNEREIHILEELADALKELGASYVLPFRFKRPDGKRTSHALIFVSKSSLGYGIMKGIMAKESSTEDQGVPSFTYSPAAADTPLLFSLARPLESLADDLSRTFAGQTLSMKAIFERHNIDTPFVEKNYKAVLNQLEAAGKIRADKPATHRPMKNGEPTFSDKTLVTFPKMKV